MDYKKYPKSLRIGFVGDQNARTPTVDISELLPELPGATATLLFRRPGEETAYPAAAQLDENGILTWTVSGGDARYPGTGCAQVLLSKGTGADEQRLLGPVIMVTVLNSIAGLASEDAPEGYESWIAEIEAAGEEAAEDAEAWAKGTRGGTAVESTDPAYHANAAYHAGQAGDSASDAEAFAKGTRGGADVGSSDPAYHNNAKYYAEQAADSAEEAGRSYAPAIRVTASGAIAHFTDAAVAPLSLDIAINPKQEGSGDPGPENVRTISGWTAVKAACSGANLINVTSVSVTSNSGITATVNPDGSSITINGTATKNGSVTTYFNGDGRTKYWPNGTYYNTGDARILLRKPDTGSQSRWIDIGSSFTITGTDCPGSAYQPFSTGDTFNNQVIKYQITAYNTSEYYPQHVEDHIISLPNDAGTVYGGVLHINQDGSGVLTVTHGYIASYAGETLPGTWISDQDVYASGTTPTTGAQVVYALASSTTYDFTAQQISSLFGENSVWADTGDVTAEYTADTKTYIERLTQPDQDWVADAGISIGKFFMVGNELYIATSGIAAGETITPGTNCTKMSLAQALNNINA